MDVEGLSFHEAAQAFVTAAEMGRGRRFADRAHGNFVWRGIARLAAESQSAPFVIGLKGG
jgi:hypothetical protein